MGTILKLPITIFFQSVNPNFYSLFIVWERLFFQRFFQDYRISVFDRTRRSSLQSQSDLKRKGLLYLSHRGRKHGYQKIQNKRMSGIGSII